MLIIKIDYIRAQPTQACFAVSSKGAPSQLLVCVRALHIGRVEECDSELKRAINRS
jgi:hypothetical protein